MLAVTKLNEKNGHLSKTSEIFWTECSSHLLTFSDVPDLESAKEERERFLHILFQLIFLLDIIGVFLEGLLFQQIICFVLTFFWFI